MARVISMNGDMSTQYFNLVEKSEHHIATLHNETSAEEIAFSPDSTTFAVSTSSSSTAQVNLWSLDTLQIIGVARMKHPAPYHFLRDEVSSLTVAFSRTGRLATAGLGMIQLWDVPSMRLIQHIGNPPTNKGLGGGSVQSIDFSPNGNSIVVGRTDKVGIVEIWNIVTEKIVTTFHGHVDPGLEYPQHIRAVACSPDEKTIASGGTYGDRMIYLWDSRTGVRTGILDPIGNGVSALEFSPNGRFLAAGIVSSKNALQIWDVQTGDNIFTFDTGYVYGVSFYPDSSVLAFKSFHSGVQGGGSEVAILDLKTKEIVAIFGHTGGVVDVCFSPDGSILAITGEGRIEIFDMSWWGNKVSLREIFKIEDINIDGVVDIQDLVLVASYLNINLIYLRGVRQQHTHPLRLHL